jgi:hypothetical protein
MKTTERDKQVPHLPTCGYMEETGSWSIDFELRGKAPTTALDGITRMRLQSSLEAFQDLCRCTEVRYESVYVGRDGSLKEARDGRFVVQTTQMTPHEILTSALQSRGYSFFTTVFVTCDTLVSSVSGEGLSCRHWFPRSSELYFGYVLTSKDSDASQTVEYRIGFETGIDVWVQRTRDPVSSEWRDNRNIANCNEPVLENALRKWEQTAGNPIVEWSSRAYKEQIFQYGFKL